MPPQIDTVIAKAVLASDQENSNQSSIKSSNRSKSRSRSIKWPKSIKDTNLLLTRFWRRYGVKISFFFTFYVIWSGFTNIIVNNDPKASSDDFSTLQGFWLLAHRIVTLFIVNFTLPGFVSLLLYTLPGEGYDDVDEDERLKDDISTIRHDPLRVIIRIVTRGDYPKLIKDNVDYHENLFKSFWRHKDDEIEIHVVSQTPLGLARSKRNGSVHRCEVKEFDIPQDYTTPNNTLYKARNNTYALDRCLEEVRVLQESLERVWVIAIDEDVFLTRRWVLEFDETVLSAKNYDEFKFVNSPSRPIFLDEMQGMGSNSSWLPPIIPFFGETFRFAMDISRVWWQAKLFGRSTVGLRGSCYGIRLDIEAMIGYDCGGPFLSVGDDTTFIHRVMMTPGVKLQFLDAWFLEGAPNTALAFMTQRARWVRNYLYCFLFSDVPLGNKIRLASFLITWTVIMPCGVLCWGSGYVLMALNGLGVIEFFPCGPAWPVVDAITCVSAACVIYWYIYGCALLLPWYWAVLVSLTFSTYIPVLPLHSIGAVAAVWGLIGAVHELYSGRADFGVTEKKAI